MKISNYLDTEPKEEMPGVVKREVITADDGAPTFAMRVIDVKPGTSSPYHTHPWEHEVFIISGQGVLKGEHGETPISGGSVFFIALNEHHCITNTGNETLHFI